MARRKKDKKVQRKLELLRAAKKCGTFPGMNRARRFVDRKKKANRNACRGRVPRD